MIRRLVMIMWLLSFQTRVFGQAKSQETELPLVAKSTIQELDRTIRLAKKKAADKLKTAMKTEMQSGNLERANRINQEILRIARLSDDSLSDNPQARVAGAWKRSDGVFYELDRNGEVRIPQNGYCGTWRAENSKVLIILNAANNKPLETSLKYLYGLPNKKEVDRQMVYVMEPSDGSGVLTLYKKEE